MRKTLAYALAVLALGTSPATSQPNNQPASLRSRVVLVTIDGMRPDFYLDERYPCPNLRRLCAEGSYADEVRPVFPSITYANHTSLVTGVPPRQHNILSNTIFQPPASATPGPTRAYNVESQKIKALPLWTRAHRQNLKVTSFSWPVTVGADIDWNVPEVFHVDGVDQETTESLLRQHSTSGLWAEFDRLKLHLPTSYAEWDAWLPQAFGWVWQNKHPDLALLHLLDADLAQHKFGKNSPQTLKAIEGVDRALGQLVEKLDRQDTTLIVSGDHGFCDIWGTLHPNRLFKEKGWLRFGSDNQLKSFDVLAHCNGGSAVIYCYKPELKAQVLALLEQAAAGHYRLLSAEEVDSLKAWPTEEPFLCAIAAEPGLALSSDWKKEFLCSNPEGRLSGQHGHLPGNVPAGLVIWGKRCPAQNRLGAVDILEVAPTVCELLGVEHQDLPFSALPITSP